MKADQLMILTSVPCVYKNFGTNLQEELRSLTIAEAIEHIKGHQFGDGNMLPKIEAAIAYLNVCPQGSVLITSLANVKDALKGKAGTVIRP